MVQPNDLHVARDLPRLPAYFRHKWEADDEGMTKKRGYSREFTTTREKRVSFMLDKIPPALWIRVKAKAKREGVSLRALILGWLREWAVSSSEERE